MTRGRKRKFNDSIPKHIDQDRIPLGIYWDKSGNGRWYVRNPHPEGGRLVAVTVANATARLSDLHSIAEQRQGIAERGTIGYVIEQFHSSTEWRELEPGTRKDYANCAKNVRAFKTKMGATLDVLQVDRLSTPAIQRVVETIASGQDGARAMPSKANHMLRYLRRLFAWGIRHGHCTTNPADGVRQAKTLDVVKMPTHRAYAAVLAYAQERGQRAAHSAGSVPPYLAPLMELATLCRMRGIEAVSLTDAHATPEGVHVARVKGSRDNIVKWTPRLRAAWDSAVAARAAILARKPNRARPVPLRASDRFLFVSQSGTPLRKSSLDTAWQRFMESAISDEVIAQDERFSLHGLKHRGITDSADKRSGGHKTEAMRQRYDHEVPVVDPATTPEFSGELSGAGK